MTVGLNVEGILLGYNVVGSKVSPSRVGLLVRG
jgi:hypothetical protein